MTTLGAKMQREWVRRQAEYFQAHLDITKSEADKVRARIRKEVKKEFDNCNKYAKV